MSKAFQKAKKWNPNGKLTKKKIFFLFSALFKAYAFLHAHVETRANLSVNVLIKMCLNFVSFLILFVFQRKAVTN